MPCNQCGGTGGKALYLPKPAPVKQQPHQPTQEGESKVAWNLNMHIPIPLQSLLPFHPHDRLDIIQLGDTLRLRKNTHHHPSTGRLGWNWNIVLSKPYRASFSLQHTDHVHLTVAGRILTIEKVAPAAPDTQPVLVPSPETSVAPLIGTE